LLKTYENRQIYSYALYTNIRMYTCKGADLDAPAELHIDDTFHVAGVGTVVAGTLLKGQISLKSNLMIGNI